MSGKEKWTLCKPPSPLASSPSGPHHRPSSISSLCIPLLHSTPPISSTYNPICPPHILPSPTRPPLPCPFVVSPTRLLRYHPSTLPTPAYQHPTPSPRPPHTHTTLTHYPYTLTPLHPKSVNHSRKKLVGLPQEELGAVSVREFLLLISRDWLHTVHSFIQCSIT